jgi:hypothetical protein
MSDRRAISAGHLAASSVAANEPWRVAVGGNRVQNMTVEQIAQAFSAGHLTVRTPLWPPGTSGWQALGNFEQFLQSGSFTAHQDYAQLSSFEEADDDPTRMWTGSGDLSELPGMDMPGMAPLPPEPSVPAPRPSARTGPRQVSSRVPAPAPRPLPAPAPVARAVSVAPTPAEVRSLRPRRSSGLWLVAGLVGLVGLGSAVLAARGGSSVAASAEAPATASLAAAPSPAAPSNSAASSPAASAEPRKPEPAPEPPTSAAQATPPASEVNQAQLAKYEDKSASAFVAEAQPATLEKASEKTVSRKALSERKSSSRKEAASKDDAKSQVAETKASEDSKSAAKEKEPAKVSSTAKRATATASTAKPKPAPAAETKVEAKVEAKEAKAEPSPAVTSAVSEAAATALGNAAKLASSCRPRGGPSGPGKARVVYSNDGEVKQVEILTAKFRDTLTGSCVNMVFRRAKIAAFKGEPPTFIKSFTIPEE